VSSSLTADQNVSTPELEDRLDQVSAGEFDAIFDLIATFESAQSRVLNENEGAEMYHDMFWSYYEPVPDGLDRATQAEGWTLLEDAIVAYDPTDGDSIPHATPAIANAVGRFVIRTRLTDGVEAIPENALVYLDAVAVNASSGDDIASEEAHAYGWGIGHPEHSVIDHLRERVSVDVFSVNPALEHAFYADQHAALDALESLIEDDSLDGTISQPRRADLSHRRYLLDCIYGLKNDEHWPKTPRYWDWHTTFDYEFELDGSVEQRVRNLVMEHGFDSDLPDDWNFYDLDV
jgi:hypothetical protein